MGLSHRLSTSSPSAAVIVKQPLSSRYYIFNSGQRNYPSSDVFYSVIDMKANNGNGKVIVKRQLLVKNSAEKIAIVKHSNKRDFWIAIKQGYTDTLFVFLLTPSGISANILTYKTYLEAESTGQIKFSPNGKYLALGNIGNRTGDSCSYLYNFDNISGSISNQRKIHTRSYCLEFSPNSKYLYCRAGYGKLGLIQYPIKNITTDFWPDSTCFYLKFRMGSGSLQLAPNGKIYGNNVDTVLRVINSPNQNGPNCDFSDNGLQILENKIPYYYRTGSLPSFMASYLRPPSFSFISHCINEPTYFLLHDSLDNDSVKWIFGDPSSGFNNYSKQVHNVSHTFKSYGSYTVSLVTYYDNRPDTSQQIIMFVNPSPDFAASDVCETDSIEFINQSSSTVGPLNYKWKLGDGQISFFKSPKHFYQIDGISKTYNVTLVVTMANGCVDSIIKPVTVNTNPSSDFSFSQNSNIVDFKAMQVGNTEYKWNFGNGDSAKAANIKYTYAQPGQFNVCLIVKNAADCYSKTCKSLGIAANTLTLTKKLRFEVHPNPNNGKFEINIENASQNIHFEIYNSIGSIVLTKVADQNNTGKFSFNLESSPGIYLIKITERHNIYFQKIIVN
jgi:PKD repeat protein